MQRVIRNSIQKALLVIAVALTGCQESFKQKQERFLMDNQSVDFSRWEGWSVYDRDSYFLLQIHDNEEIICHLVFWKEKKLNNTIIVRFPDSGSSYSTLGDLPNEPVWRQHYDWVNYLDLYDMIQLVYNYNLVGIVVQKEDISITIDNQLFLMSHL